MNNDEKNTQASQSSNKYPGQRNNNPRKKINHHGKHKNRHGNHQNKETPIENNNNNSNAAKETEQSKAQAQRKEKFDLDFFKKAPEADYFYEKTDKEHKTEIKTKIEAEAEIKSEIKAEIETEAETEYSITVDLDDDSSLLTREPVDTPDDDSQKVEIIGIRFKKAGKVYYFAPSNMHFKAGDYAIVETARGLEFGEVVCGNRMVSEKDIVQPLRCVVRPATKEDILRNDENKKKEEEAFSVCREKIAAHGLDMKLVDVEYTFDNSKLMFYFTSAGRVDFRDLVKDLASVFRTRIELRQIGIRDEAKLMGGLGVCGRSLCCNTFLSDFVQVSIKMAKEQNLSLNSTKISGACGRLMCCLRYEHEVYEQELRLSPPLDAVVKTEDGMGVVIEVNPIAGIVKVKNTDKPDILPKYYKRDNVKIIKAPKISQNDSTSEEADSCDN